MTRYRADIDALRAIAVTGVVVFHAAPGAIPGGFVGVDVFFVISGYLIAGIIWSQLETGRFSLLNFYSRRAHRLFPALIVVMTASMALAPLMLLPDEIERLGQHILAGALFVSNLVFWSESGYFDTDAHEKLTLHLWSLAVEEQYYIVWPLIAIALFKLRRKLTVPLVCMLGASLLACILSTRTSPSSAFFLVPFRAWEFLLGSLVALHPERLLRHSGMATALSIAGLACIGGSFLWFDSKLAFPGAWAIVPALGTALVIAAGDRALPNSTLLANRALVFVGKLSYPLYLWHWPLLAYLYLAQQGPAPPAWRIAAMVLALVLATLTYLGLERPWQGLVQRSGPNRRPLGLLVAAMAVCMVGASMLWEAPTMLSRGSENASQITRSMDWPGSMINSSACQQRFAGLSLDYCAMTDSGRAATVALLGDSHANQLFPGMSTYFRNRGDNLVNLGSCVPFTDVQDFDDGTVDGCRQRANAYLDRVLTDPVIHTVVIANRWASRITGYGVGPEELALRPHHTQRIEPDGRAVRGQPMFERGLRELAERTRHAGKRLVVILDTPEMGFDPRECFALRPFTFRAGAKRTDCTVPRQAVEARVALYEPIVRALAGEYNHMRVFDPTPVLCDHQRCAVMQGSTLLYRDINHLSQAGSRALAAHYDF